MRTLRKRIERLDENGQSVENASAIVGHIQDILDHERANVRLFRMERSSKFHSISGLTRTN